MHFDHPTPDNLRGAGKLRLHTNQFQVFDSPARFRVVVAGRRFGKTELAIAEILSAASNKPNQLIWYVGPSEKFVKRVMWRRLKKATQMYWASKPLETERRIELKNGSVIIVNGAFEPDSLRGDGLDFAVLDEVADLKAEAWGEVLRPSLADRHGRALFIGTPQGRNHLFDFFELAQTNPDWASFHFTTEEGGLVTSDELESAGREIDVNTFRQEFGAEFTALGKFRAYVSFDRSIHVREVSYDQYRPLIWALDFNVDPMCMLILQQDNDETRVLEERFVRPNATTLMACNIFHNRVMYYMGLSHVAYKSIEVRVYGDASGNQRHTSGGGTDWTIIRDFFRPYYPSISLNCLVPGSNPFVRDRVNCVNARLLNKHGQARLFIDPSCKELIRDFEEVCWAVDTTGAPMRELDKSDRNRTHMSDALGYYLSHRFPLKVPGLC